MKLNIGDSYHENNILDDSCLTREEKEELSSKNETLDLITSIDLIEQAEKSPYMGDRQFLKKLLGIATFMKMWKLGYINAGYIKIENNKIIHPSYTVTERYIDTKDSIRRQRKSLIFDVIKHKLQTILQ